jgi:hypothetical protein
VNEPSKKSRRVPRDQEPQSQRRRVGTVVHDDRGNASVSWRNAPKDLERPVLEVLGEAGLSIKSEESCDPYASHPGTRRNAGRGARTDLRKLSEHIKKMRELEARKRRGED